MEYAKWPRSLPPLRQRPGECPGANGLGPGPDQPQPLRGISIQPSANKSQGDGQSYHLGTPMIDLLSGSNRSLGLLHGCTVYVLLAVPVPMWHGVYEISLILTLTL